MIISQLSSLRQTLSGQTQGGAVTWSWFSLPLAFRSDRWSRTCRNRKRSGMPLRSYAVHPRASVCWTARPPVTPIPAAHWQPIDRTKPRRRESNRVPYAMSYNKDARFCIPCYCTANRSGFVCRPIGSFDLLPMWQRGNRCNGWARPVQQTLGRG